MPKSPTSHYQAASFCHSTSDMSIYLAAVPQRLQLVGLMIQYNVLVILVPVLLANIVCESEKMGAHNQLKRYNITINSWDIYFQRQLNSAGLVTVWIFK